MRTLLFAQRVNRQFSALIRTSPKLQRALLFRPEEPGTNPINENGDGHLDDWRLPPNYKNPEIIPGRKLIELRLNTLLLKIFPWLCPGDEIGLGPNQFRDLPWVKSKVASNAFRRRNASLHRMLLSQPPAASIFVYDFELNGYRQDEDHLKTTLKDRSEGLHMGSVYDLMYSHTLDRGAQHNEGYTSEIHWPGYREFDQDEPIIPVAKEFKHRGIVVMPLSRTGKVKFACVFVAFAVPFEGPSKRMHEFGSVDAPRPLDITWRRADGRGPLLDEEYP